MSEINTTPPPVGEEIHLPGPSLIPILNALGITLLVIGTTINPLITYVGILLTVGTIIRWVLDTRKDIAELPEEHHVPGH